MVVHMEVDQPKMPFINQTTYSKFKIENHLRDVSSESQNHLTENVFTQDQKKNKNDSAAEPALDRLSNLKHIQATSIDCKDLEELISVYKKCKDVMQKIELKYGHLINLEENEKGDDSNQRKRKLITESGSCTCQIQKKILFDESGNPTEQLKLPISDHICIKKSDQLENYASLQQKPLGLKIEYDEVDTLPDDIKSLLDILKASGSNIDKCRKIVKKIKLIQEEYRYELKFSRPFFVVKVKSEPENLFQFPGSNLFSLPGYPVYE